MGKMSDIAPHFYRIAEDNIVFHDGERFATCNLPSEAAFIVKACNAHDSLVEALEEIQNALIHVEGDRQGNRSRTAIFTDCQNFRIAFNKAMTALQKARE